MGDMYFNAPSQQNRGLFFPNLSCFEKSTPEESMMYLLKGTSGSSSIYDLSLHPCEAWYAAIHTVIEGLLERCHIPVSKVASLDELKTVNITGYNSVGSISETLSDNNKRNINISSVERSSMSNRWRDLFNNVFSFLYSVNTEDGCKCTPFYCEKHNGGFKTTNWNYYFDFTNNNQLSFAFKYRNKQNDDVLNYITSYLLGGRNYTFVIPQTVGSQKVFSDDGAVSTAVDEWNGDKIRTLIGKTASGFGNVCYRTIVDLLWCCQAVLGRMFSSYYIYYRGTNLNLNANISYNTITNTVDRRFDENGNIITETSSVDVSSPTTVTLTTFSRSKGDAFSKTQNSFIVYGKLQGSITCESFEEGSSSAVSLEQIGDQYYYKTGVSVDFYYRPPYSERPSSDTYAFSTRHVVSYSKINTNNIVYTTPYLTRPSDFIRRNYAPSGRIITSENAVGYGYDYKKASVGGYSKEQLVSGETGRLIVKELLSTSDTSITNVSKGMIDDRIALLSEWSKMPCVVDDTVVFSNGQYTVRNSTSDVVKDFVTPFQLSIQDGRLFELYVRYDRVQKSNGVVYYTPQGEYIKSPKTNEYIRLFLNSDSQYFTSLTLSDGTTVQVPVNTYSGFDYMTTATFSDYFNFTYTQANASGASVNEQTPYDFYLRVMIGLDWSWKSMPCLPSQ